MVSGANSTIRVVVEGDVAAFNAAMRSAKDEVERLDRSTAPAQSGLSQIAGGFNAATAGALAGAAALGAAAGALSSFVSDALEAEQANTRLEAVLRASGGAAGISANDIRNNSAALMELTGTADEALNHAQTLFLTFRNIGGEAFGEATELALDMANVFGMDLSSAALMLGKALNEPTQGLTALRRAGVQMSDEQEEQIRRFVELGDVASAQRIILDELKTEVGGVSRALGEDAAGKIDRFKANMGEMKESIGTAVKEGFDPLLDRALEWSKSDEALQFTNNMGEAMGGLAQLTSEAAGAVGDLNTAFAPFGGIGGFIDKLTYLGRPGGASEDVGRGISDRLKGMFDLEAEFRRSLAGSAPITAESIEAGEFSRSGSNRPDQFPQTLFDAQGNAMGGRGSGVSALSDILRKTPEEQAKIDAAVREARGNLEMAILPDLTPRTGRGGGGSQADAFSAESLALIQQIMAALPAGGGFSLDKTGLAAFQAEEGEFSRIRESLTRELAQLGLAMADLDAQGQENSGTFKGLEDRAGALKDSLERIDLVEDLRLGPFKDAMDLVRESADAAIEAEKRLADERQKGMLSYLNQLGQRNVRFAPGVFETLAKAGGLTPIGDFPNIDIVSS